MTLAASWILQPVAKQTNVNSATPYAERARMIEPSALARKRVAFGNSLLSPW